MPVSSALMKQALINTIALNIRYPKGTSPEQIKSILENLPVASVSLSEHGHTPHYVPMEDPLVQTLLNVYEKQTGLKGHEQVIGGGTFGRLLERGVAYGAMFPDSIDTMHQANEFIALDDSLPSSSNLCRSYLRIDQIKR